MDDPTVVKLLSGAVTVLGGVVALLWKEQRRWQRMWTREVKERSSDARLFLNALDKSRQNSLRPPTSREKTTNLLE
jgi:hypothetical protein